MNIQIPIVADFNYTPFGGAANSANSQLRDAAYLTEEQWEAMTTQQQQDWITTETANRVANFKAMLEAAPPADPPATEIWTNENGTQTQL